VPEAASAFFLLFVPVLFVTLLCRCVLLRSSQSLCLFGVRVNAGFCWGNELRRWPTGQRPCFHGNLAARRVQGRERTDSTPTPSLCRLEHGATSCAAGRPDSDRAFTATLLPGGSRVVNGPMALPTPSLCRLEHGATSCAAGRPDSDRALTATLLPGGSRVVIGPMALPTPSLCRLEHGATSCATGRPDSDRAFTATLLPGGSLGQFGRRSLRRLGGDRSHACPSSRRVAPRPFWPKVITTPRGRP